MPSAERILLFIQCCWRFICPLTWDASKKRRLPTLSVDQ